MKKSLIAIAILSMFTGAANAAEAVLIDDNASVGQSQLQKAKDAQNYFESMPREMVNFNWIGGSIGMSNKTFSNPATAGFGVGQAAPVGIVFNNPSNSNVQPNINLNFTKGVVFNSFSGSKVTNFGVAGEVNLLALNSRLIPLFKIDGVVVLPGESLIFMPNLGYSVRTSTAVGLDAIHPICDQNDCSVSLKFGITKFNKTFAGSTFVANIGIVKAF